MTERHDYLSELVEQIRSGEDWPHIGYALKAKEERDRLWADKAELLAALENAIKEIEELHRRAAERDWIGYSNAAGVGLIHTARAAIAKAKEQGA